MSAAKDVADAVLAAVVAQADAADVTLPSRRYVSNGAPAVDREQVTVHVRRTFAHSGDVTVQVAEPLVGAVGYAMRGVELAVTIMRCEPVPKGQQAAPPVAKIDESAGEVLTDADLIHDALTAYGRSSGCNSLAVTEWTALDPEAGFVGGQTTALISLV